MKTKLFLSMAAVALLASCGTQKQAVATQGQQQQMTLPKQKGDYVEDLVKQYTAEGYKSESMAFTMYESIYAYREKLKGNVNLVEITSDGVGASSFAAEQSAANAAAIKYATAAGSVVKGGMEREFGTLESKNWDAFHGAFVQDVANFIVPLLKKEMKFYKKEGNLYNVRIGYTLDENKASEARSKAAENALKNLGDGTVFGEGVRKYVKENVTVEQ